MPNADRMGILQECVVCAASVISEENTLNKPTLKNNLTVYFLVKKMLDISDSTFVRLLKSWGDPCSWIYCCWKCSKTVTEAQNLFVEIKKQEEQLNQLQKALKRNVYKTNQNQKFTMKKCEKKNAIQMIREETVDRLDLADIELNISNVEDEIEIKLEDDIAENFPDEVEDNLMYQDIDENEGHYNEESCVNTVENEPKSKPRNKANSIKRNSKASHLNVKVVVEKYVQRSRSGRIIKSVKYNSDSEFSDACHKEIDETSSHSDCSLPKSPTTKDDGDDTIEEKLNEGKESCKIGNEPNETVKKNANTYKCKLCHKSYAWQYNLKRHTKKVHGLQVVFVSNKNKVAKKPLSEKDRTCDKCGKIYKKLWDLKKHIKTIHEGPPKKTFDCEVCPSKFNSNYKLHLHKGTHNKDRSKCPECGKVLASRKSLKYHIHRVHKNERNFLCEICNATFVSRIYLKYHQIKVHNIESENNINLKCNECGKVFGAPNVLREHINFIHRGIFKLRCPVCNIGQRCISSMERHLRRAHTNERSEVCEVCQKSFFDKTRLKCHMLKHTGERPYKCQFCPKDFTNNKARRRHEESIHSEKKPYQCETCGKSYPSKDYLTTHRWYSHNNKQSTLPPKSILPTEDVQRIVREEILKKNLPTPETV